MKFASLLLVSLGGLVAACSNDAIDYSARTAPVGACGEVETHIVGIYDNHGKVVEINIDRPGKHNVVVSAYAATKWKINATNGAHVLNVYAVGYHEQKVAVPAGTKVMKDSHDTTGVFACGFTDGESHGCDSAQLEKLAGKMIFDSVSSFHGCSSASNWTIGEDLSTSSNCAAESQYDSLAGCIAYMAGENTCGDGGGGGDGGGSGGGDGTGGGTGGGGQDPQTPDGDGSGEAGPVFL